mmetsp:Transcript_23627/g.66294  ORF Transcript_23627/g.66294 Transcript_23627/m.66294 type:complete len:220 (+) Transcript_23627:1697-2356(+)
MQPSMNWSLVICHFCSTESRSTQSKSWCMKSMWITTLGMLYKSRPGGPNTVCTMPCSEKCASCAPAKYGACKTSHPFCLKWWKMKYTKSPLMRLVETAKHFCASLFEPWARCVHAISICWSMRLMNIECCGSGAMPWNTNTGETLYFLKASSSLSTKPKIPGGTPPRASAKGSFSAWIDRSQCTASIPTLSPWRVSSLPRLMSCCSARWDCRCRTRIQA